MKNKIASLVLLLALLISSTGNAQAAPSVDQAQPDTGSCTGLVVVLNPARHEGARGLRHVAYDCGVWKWVGDSSSGHWINLRTDVNASPNEPTANHLTVPNTGSMPDWTPAELLLMTPEELAEAGIAPEVFDQAVVLYSEDESSNGGNNGASTFAPGHLKKEEGEQNASTLTPAAQALAAGDGEVYTPPALADVIDDTSGNSGNSGDSSGNSSADESGCFTNNGGTHCPNGHAP